MKLTIREDSLNYAAQIIKLPAKQPVVGLDNLVKVTFQGNDVLTKKDADENILYVFFPVESEICAPYLSHNNEYRNTTLNRDNTQKGYFEDSGRVKAIKFKGVISTGYIAPVSTLDDFTIGNLKEGDEFTTIDGIDICKKYKPVRQQSTKEPGESKHNKKLKRFDKLVPNQFRFHQDTSQLAKNLHLFNPEDIIVITDKWHGTSAVFANVQVKAELNWKERLARLFWYIITGDKLGEATKYDNLYSSRSVIKNQYINKEQGGGYYGEDIWAVVNKELDGKIEPGISLYGEIVGFTPGGKAVQKGYDYGCNSPEFSFKTQQVGVNEIQPAHKFLVYRITYTKSDGNTIEFSWNQIREYCAKYSIETVKELWFGNILLYLPMLDSEETDESYRLRLFKSLQEDYLEKDCPYNKPKTPAEGIVVRIDGKSTYSAYKLKSKRFLEGESKALDKGEVGIEEEVENG